MSYIFDKTIFHICQVSIERTNNLHEFEHFKIPTALVFQLEVYYKVVLLLKKLEWYSNTFINNDVVYPARILSQNTLPVYVDP